MDPRRTVRPWPASLIPTSSSTAMTRGFRGKQALATDLLRRGILDGSLFLAHQVLIEFIAVVTRPIARGPSLLTVDAAHREVEDLLVQLPVIYPTENTVRTALRGAALY